MWPFSPSALPGLEQFEPSAARKARSCGAPTGGTLAAYSPNPAGLPVPVHHKSGIPAGRNGIHAPPILGTGPRREPSKTVAPCKRYRGLEFPLLRLFAGISQDQARSRRQGFGVVWGRLLTVWRRTRQPKMSPRRTLTLKGRRASVRDKNPKPAPLCGAALGRSHLRA